MTVILILQNNTNTCTHCDHKPPQKLKTHALYTKDLFVSLSQTFTVYLWKLMELNIWSVFKMIKCITTSQQECMITLSGREVSVASSSLKWLLLWLYKHFMKLLQRKMCMSSPCLIWKLNFWNYFGSKILAGIIIIDCEVFYCLFIPTKDFGKKNVLLCKDGCNTDCQCCTDTFYKS